MDWARRREPSRTGARPRRAALLLSLAFALLAGAWLIATPPGSAFDEPAQYVKAIGVGRGQLLGRPPGRGGPDLGALYRYGAKDPGALARLGSIFSSPAVRWQARTTRTFSVPPRLMRANFGCTYGRRGTDAACVAVRPPLPRQREWTSYVGTYQPYVYVLPGAAMRLSSDPSTAMRLGRLATLVASVGLLVAAAYALRDPDEGALSLLGLVVAVTPMVLFTSSVLSTSGPEIAAAICFLAALLRLGRGHAPAWWLWVVLAVSGAVLGAARALGPGFVVAAVVAVAVLTGPRTCWRVVRPAWRWATATGAVVAVACVASLWWEFSFQPRPAPSRSGVRDSIGPSWSNLRDVGKEVVGVFGALDAPPPAFVFLLWGGLFVAVTVVALIVGRPMERLKVVLVLVAGVAATMAMSIVYREIGPLHGRYAMPFLALLPLWTGEVVLRRRERLPLRVRTVLVASILTIAAALQLVAWWSSARRFAVGQDGSWWFADQAGWAPPLGWWPWIALAAAGGAGYVAVALAAARGSVRP